MPILHKPHNVQHDSTSITKIQDFGWTEQGTAIPSRGDRDTYASAVIPVGVDCSVTATSTPMGSGLDITMLDEASTLTAHFQVAQGTSATVTILNATYLGGTKSIGAGEPNVTNAWLPRSADGTTTPISITGA